MTGLEPQTPTARGQRLASQKPLALLADIHANLPALQAVLDVMDQQGIGQALVLGDIVGYGPHPSEVIDVVRQRGFATLKGNHDYAVAENQFKKGFSSYAKVAAEWTRTRLDAEELDWLDSLPLYLSQDDWLAVHGAPQDPTYIFGYVYHMTYESNLDHLAGAANPHVFPWPLAYERRLLCGQARPQRPKPRGATMSGRLPPVSGVPWLRWPTPR